MAWHKKYWDSVDQFYWNPRLLCLPSIPKKLWGSDPDFIMIDRKRVKNGGSVYARQGTAKQNVLRMRSFEEPLNHIFDITFAIAADPVIARLIHAHLNIVDAGPYERLGREVQQRYGWLDVNVTQQDGFFISPKSAVGVELKIKSRTWPVQTLKYLALMVLEEQLTGHKEQLGLLYITPSEDTAGLWRDCGASSDGVLRSDFFEACENSKPNKTIEELLKQHRPAFENAAARLKLSHVSWGGLWLRVPKWRLPLTARTAERPRWRDCSMGFVKL